MSKRRSKKANLEKKKKGDQPKQAAQAKKPPVAKKPVSSAAATAAKRSSRKQKGPARELTFGRDTYIWMGGGFALMVIGMLLMTGGENPDPNVWDEDVIYSFRRITLAPIVILGGIGAVIYAILKK